MSESINSRYGEIRRSIYINASLSMVYDSWAISEDLEKWFVENKAVKEEDQDGKNLNSSIEKSDHFKWEGFLSPNTLMSGHVSKIKKDSYIIFEFEEGSSLHLSFKSIDIGRTEVRLVHTFKVQEMDKKHFLHHQYSISWTFWLVNLKAFLEHGITLDRNEVFGMVEKQETIETC